MQLKFVILFCFRYDNIMMNVYKEINCIRKKCKNERKNNLANLSSNHRKRAKSKTEMQDLDF